MISPFFVNLYTTLRCNYRCRYCYVKPMYANKDLSRKTADALIQFISKQIKDTQDLIINFHGGEPTLNYPIILHIIENLSKTVNNKTSYGITTNGSLLNEDMVRFIGKNFNYNVSISLDGQEETHRANRNCTSLSNSYQDIVNYAQMLLKYNPQTRIRMTYDRECVNKLFENIRYFIELGFTCIVPVADYYATNWTDGDFARIKEQYNKLKIYLKENRLVGIMINEISDFFHELSPCTAGNDYFSVDPLGNIYPCTHLVQDEQYILGDVFHGIDQNKVFSLQRKNAEPIDECLQCALYPYCDSTRCKLINLATTGDMYRPNLVTCNLMCVKSSLMKGGNI